MTSGTSPTFARRLLSPKSGSRGEAGSEEAACATFRPAGIVDPLVMHEQIGLCGGAAERWRLHDSGTCGGAWGERVTDR
eukprot:CAMPEP_0181236108 /NCGR_PEP_ID=MMETSP1096-20121128/37979_1 /TAXON_ID=156174 ORGANISM="Chrysochromulina ericina, Strain CCMP281" /NCGR_SAMPLE_ID=MMETSP1096 /ASSEMBLY_ACC=CAM_ASM_000453 /LENGTH=78 /DNA_ID=CAMNT_0023331225 /DNA_START=262 /DNA_END=495 /DNA_ORIENTATION=+